MSTDDEVKKALDYHLLCSTTYSKSFNDFPLPCLFSARQGIHMEHQRAGADSFQLTVTDFIKAGSRCRPAGQQPGAPSYDGC